MLTLQKNRLPRPAKSRACPARPVKLAKPAGLTADSRVNGHLNNVNKTALLGLASLTQFLVSYLVFLCLQFRGVFIRKLRDYGSHPLGKTGTIHKFSLKICVPKKKTSRYKAGGYCTVIFCPYTPESELAKKWREVEAREAETKGWRYKVVESGLIVCKNPWAGPCTDSECFICSTGGRGTLPWTLDNQDTVGTHEEESTKLTRKQTKHQMQ